MALKATINLKLGEAFQSQRQKIDKELGKQLEAHITLIAQRVGRGNNFAGSAMGSYKQGRWRKIREAKGRQTSRVDLNFSGNMLKAMTSEVRRAGQKTLGTIEFRDTITRYSGRQINLVSGKGRTVRDRIKAQGNQRRFNFFGIDRKQIDHILNKLQQSIRL